VDFVVVSYRLPISFAFGRPLPRRRRFKTLLAMTARADDVNRAKGGIESVHPLHGPELRALRPLQGKSPYVFVTEAGSPVTTAWFLRMVGRTGKAARLPFPVHPHMLRHSTYKLANDGHDTRWLAHYLGHRNLQSTARYTALPPDRLARFWQD